MRLSNVMHSVWFDYVLLYCGNKLVYLLFISQLVAIYRTLVINRHINNQYSTSNLTLIPPITRLFHLLPSFFIHKPKILSKQEITTFLFVHSFVCKYRLYECLAVNALTSITKLNTPSGISTSPS